MRGRALGVTLLLVAGLAGLGPVAEAGHGSGGCGSAGPRLTTTASCSFDLRGIPVRVSGHARDPQSNRQISIRVWAVDATDEMLSRVTGHTPFVIAECTASGAGFAQCSDDFGIGEQIDFLRPTGERLWCMMEATPSGNWTPRTEYWCDSGRGY